ncbi:MAG TPA: FimV/HubP family polar landmark protein, partial [Candidatus Acidoferrum sp.]|nr:FimV/HubP family polar landmark protein [Candidatus Acidoferrum sp.]
MRSTFQAGKAFPALALAFAIASHAHAQGLGEITLESSLHEPLRAHIDLLDIGNLDSTQIKAALGTQTEFKVAGIERTAQLSALNFTVETRKGGVGRIVITSDGEINEPYLDFMLGVDWPKGRTLREYTLLLDLPENHAKSSTNAPAVSRESAVATAPPAPASASATPPASKPAAAQQYEVKTGDSLYQIAEQTRPSAQVGVQQMMIAIQRANEDAFVNNNVNRILTGKVLRIPRMEEITLIDQEAAVAQVNQQNAALNSETLAVNNAPNAPKAAPHDELTLLSGDQDAKVAGSNDLNATIKQLENQLMTSEEGLDRARLENLELTNRLAAVQEQIDLLQNIIAIEDERIAQMQSQLSKQSAATKEALAKAESSSAGKDGGSDSGLIGLLSNSVVLLGAALAAALGVAGMLFVRRRNAQAALAGDAEVELDSVADVASTDTGDSTGDEVPGG